MSQEGLFQVVARAVTDRDFLTKLEKERSKAATEITKDLTKEEVEFLDNMDLKRFKEFVDGIRDIIKAWPNKTRY